jgi:PAS domain S-box-containing protein
LGYSRAVFFGLNLNAIVPEKDARLIIEQLGENSRGPRPRKISIETCHQTTDGDRIPVEIHSRAITYRGRKVILNVARDISKRIEAEKALRESEERYRSVVENSHDGIMIIDESFHILYANDVLSQILGCPRSEIEGSDFRKYLGAESAGLTSDQFLDGQGKEKEPSGDIYKIVRENADERTVKISAIRIQDSSGKEKIVAQILDITDQLRAEQENKQLETQLHHAQKMEAVGTLAGGVAHDFNNILTAIQGYASLMRLKMDSEHPLDEYVDGIEDGVTSAANLTNQLLGFARKSKYTLRPTNLNEIVEKSCKMFTRTTKDIKVIQMCQEDIWKVEADPGQMEQVLLNLYLNARHAMPDGGELYIQTKNVTLSEDYCRPFEVPGGNYVNVSVTDEGTGMDKETMERIFEPFFTTKEVGEGTGLGLASAYGIIKNHNGFIRVYSEKGHGATFNISLPASDAEDLDDVHVKTELIRGSETILLVDDEEAPIHVEEMMLKELGYRVLTARSGKEAISLYKENKGGLDLVALDMIMPEMGGRDTYDRLKKIDPDVKVLLVSGYSLNKQVEELLEKGCNGFMQKPFDIIQLSHKIREVLDHGREIAPG